MPSCAGITAGEQLRRVAFDLAIVGDGDDELVALLDDIDGDVAITMLNGVSEKDVDDLLEHVPAHERAACHR